MNLAQMKGIINAMQEKAVPPIEVESDEQATILTARDPLGRVWMKGDRFFVVAIDGQDTPQRPDAPQVSR